MRVGTRAGTRAGTHRTDACGHARRHMGWHARAGTRAGTHANARKKCRLNGKSKIGTFLSKIHSPREVRIDTHAGRPMTYKHVML